VDGKMFDGIIRQTITAIIWIICIQNNFISSGRNQETVISKRLLRVEVEYKNQVLAHIGQYLVTVIMPYFLDRSSLEVLYAFYNSQHGSIKVTHIMICQILVVHQIPLTAGIFTRPTVTFTGEVNPFRMSEFIAHKVKITAIDSSRSQ